MAARKQFWIVLFFLICEQGFANETKSTEKPEKEVLEQSESKDGKLEIIKRIKKINEDGSYTIGYEADDGSFKIESRDVLGNIKGTYGFVDEQGEIKRVSYSTSNSSEIITKTESPSVVQRIPKLDKAISSTRRPSIVYPSSSPSSTVNILQNIARRRASTTSAPKNYTEGLKNPKPIIYTPAPRVLLPKSTTAAPILAQKNDEQIIRPDLPSFRRLGLKPFEDSKPVEEKEEVRSNILRRELGQGPNPGFNPQDHIFSVQQSLGPGDSDDVYSGSLTTGTPRPLFTTTLRPRIFASTTSSPVAVPVPSGRYNTLQDVEPTTTTDYSSSSSEGTTAAQSTPPPIVQIPANRVQEVVAVRTPYQRGTILVPLSQVQRGLAEGYEAEDKPVQQIQRPIPVPLRRLPPPHLRPIPVQVDENGYVRELPPHVPTPYPVPVVSAIPKYANQESQNEVDEIEPPVSTREFQKLLQQLILRQSRLERISALTRAQLHQQRARQSYPVPYYVQREEQGPVQFAQEGVRRDIQYVNVPHRIQQHSYQGDYTESYTPTRRVARLLPAQEQQQQQQEDEEYLPPDVREMLLLRMLQLAINPALPLEDEEGEVTTTHPQYKRVPVRNVEILGEEPDQIKRPARIKRYMQEDY